MEEYEELEGFVGKNVLLIYSFLERGKHSKREYIVKVRDVEAPNEFEQEDLGIVIGDDGRKYAVWRGMEVV
ncbi:MAG: hypothetical protein U9Q06_01955 [Nanoarchaeota archaeon]|nr:hypothetical protein [Nanoarchaeota archaeon]